MRLHGVTHSTTSSRVAVTSRNVVAFLTELIRYRFRALFRGVGRIVVNSGVARYDVAGRIDSPVRETLRAGST